MFFGSGFFFFYICVFLFFCFFNFSKVGQKAFARMNHILYYYSFISVFVVVLM